MPKNTASTPGDEPTGTTSGRVPRKRGAIVAADVARIAGVSTATVSRALNYPDRVSDDVRSRIESVMKTLKWAPHGAARALASRRSNAIGAVFPTLTYGDFTSAIQALQHELATHNYTLLLAFSEYDLEQENRQVRNLLERGVDGLILVGTLHHPDVSGLLAQYDIPCVNAFVFDPASPHPCIGPDNHKALHRLTRYLIDLGHTRFGILGQSTKNNDRVQARLRGVRDALAEQGIAVPPKHQVEGRWGIAEGRNLLRKILAQAPVPTALICGNGYFAIGAVLECQRLGIRVPDDISIVGYDDFEIMSELPIGITTVRVSGVEVGRRCARMLMAKLAGVADGVGYECKAELVIRASSGPPRTHDLELPPVTDGTDRVASDQTIEVS